MIEITKIGSKVALNDDTGSGRIVENTYNVLYEKDSKIIITKDIRNYDLKNDLSLDPLELTDRPSDNTKEVAEWLVATYFTDGIAGETILYLGEFTNYTDLTTREPAGDASRFAFVLNSQGTSWMPGSMGGSYYGAGWYYDTGSIWSNKNDEIYAGMEELSSLNIQNNKTANYAATVNDSIQADTTAGTFTITLPIASTVSGREIVVTKIDSSLNSLIIAASGSDTIVGAPTLELTRQFESLQLLSNGVNWFIN